jgi:exopolysaccharide biosynthesis protein
MLKINFPENRYQVMRERMKTNKKRTIFHWLIPVMLIVGGILYLLADRYLIPRVEMDVVSADAGEVSETTTILESSLTENAITATAVPVVSDDWNYQNGTVFIAIQKVVTGSGSDQVTYFVADVVLADATDLENAFANDQFGRNIIEYTSAIAEENNAIFAINGDYYGFRDDGIIIRNGVIYRDVPVRTGLAFYRDGTIKIYDETQTSAQELLDEGVWNTLSFGPALIENSVIAANFDDASVDHNFGNHSIIGSNPRTGVGIIDSNHFVFVVVDGRSKGYSRGVTLTEFSEIFKELGCTDAYNIDGGGSSTMYFMGRVVNNPLGENRERGTSDILFIGQ